MYVILMQFYTVKYFSTFMFISPTSVVRVTVLIITIRNNFIQEISTSFTDIQNVLLRKYILTPKGQFINEEV